MEIKICSTLKNLIMTLTLNNVTTIMVSNQIMSTLSIISVVLLIKNTSLLLISSSLTEDLIPGVELVQPSHYLTLLLLALYVILYLISALGAHHLDLRPPNSADPADVIQCRKTVLDTLKKWITQKKLSQEQKLLRSQ